VLGDARAGRFLDNCELVIDMVHPSIARAKATIERIDRKIPSFEAWREAHADELAEARIAERKQRETEAALLKEAQRLATPRSPSRTSASPTAPSYLTRDWYSK
jgi:hypothetical protein